MMIEVAKGIAPQVDRLFIALNEYDRVPDELALLPNVEAVIPEANLLDVGKFLFEPNPEDYVVTIDDDLLYPLDYVERFMKIAKKIDMQRSVLGYLGAYYENWSDIRKRVTNIKFIRRPVGGLTGVEWIGTGTGFYLGSAFPKLSDMKGSEEFTDIRAGRYFFENGICPWLMPRERAYLTAMDHHYDRGREIHARPKVLNFAAMEKDKSVYFGKADHAGKRYFNYIKARSKAENS